MASGFSVEANDVELFDRVDEYGYEIYNHAYNNLLEIFPAMKRFAWPMQYAVDNKLPLTKLSGLFNITLSAFKEILQKSEYVCAKVKLRPEDILDEYFYSQGEALPTNVWERMAVKDTNGQIVITFSSFARTLRHRHEELVRKGVIDGKKKFPEPELTR